MKNLLFHLPYSSRNLFLNSIKRKPVPDKVLNRLLYAQNRYNCIFFHIPKNAGTSINMSLYGEKDTQHIGILSVLRIFDNFEFNNAFKFAFVRNPFDRLVSSYHHLLNGGWETDHDSDFFNRHGDVTQYGFGQFVRWLSYGQNAYEHVVLIPQHEFICLGRHVMVDYLGKYENIAEDFNYVSKIIGLSGHLTKTNSTNHKEYTSYYDDELKMICKNIYKNDFEIFGYE